MTYAARISVVPILFAVLTASIWMGVGQETKKSEPRTRMDAPPTSPDVQKGGRVNFAFRAPGAREVKLAGQWGPETVLQKGENGLWTATTDPIQPGIYEYHFVVDGLSVIDPLNPAIKPQRQPGSSILHVPANLPAAWDLQDVPHGTVHQHTYFSKSLGRWRELVVYSPPGYGKTADGFPVLYLSHGFSDNQATWTVHGKAHWILDNLIAQGKAQPMLIVMPDAHSIPPGGGWKEDYGKANTEAFAKEMLEEVIPLVESAYQVRKEAAGRAFAGLSMGGRHALHLALTASGTFSQIGAFSAAPPDAEVTSAGLAKPKELNANLKLLWIACGKDDFLFKRNQDFLAAAKAAGLTLEWHETEGNHSWPVWRNFLTEFAPRLFPKS